MKNNFFFSKQPFLPTTDYLKLTAKMGRFVLSSTKLSPNSEKFSLETMPSTTANLNLKSFIPRLLDFYLRGFIIVTAKQRFMSLLESSRMRNF